MRRAALPILASSNTALFLALDSIRGPTLRRLCNTAAAASVTRPRAFAGDLAGVFFKPRSGDIEMTRMPEKDPSFLAVVILAMRDHGLAVALAFALSYVRILYDAKEPRPVRQIIEALLGAIITLVVGISCEKFGLSSGWSFFAAGFIGILGVEQVRQLGRKWAARKADGQ